MSKMEIIVGTNNQGKLKEMQSAYPLEEVAFVPYTFYTKQACEVEETGHTYLENAIIKAQFYAKHIGQPVLADDGGLELQAFPKLLGIETARFFQPNQTDTEKNQQLLRLFEKTVPLSRTITLHAVLVYAWPNGQYIFSAKELQGEMAEEETGKRGYGFDKIIYVPEMQKTLAQLPEDQRNQLSPRVSALKQVIEELKERQR